MAHGIQARPHLIRILPSKNIVKHPQSSQSCVYASSYWLIAVKFFSLIFLDANDFLVESEKVGSYILALIPLNKVRVLGLALELKQCCRY